MDVIAALRDEQALLLRRIYKEFLEGRVRKKLLEWAKESFASSNAWMAIVVADFGEPGLAYL